MLGASPDILCLHLQATTWGNHRFYISSSTPAGSQARPGHVRALAISFCFHSQHPTSIPTLPPCSKLYVLAPQCPSVRSIGLALYYSPSNHARRVRSNVGSHDPNRPHRRPFWSQHAISRRLYIFYICIMSVGLVIQAVRCANRAEASEGHTKTSGSLIPGARSA